VGFVRRLTGKTAATAAKEAAGIQAGFAEQAGALYDPFQQLGQQGLDQAGFLTDSQAQYDWLQNNPLFQGALSNANDATMGMAAARGRVSAGDTLQQLSQNTLLAAAPLIAQQKGSIGDLLNIGQNVAGNQGNLLTGQGAALAGGIIGAENARAAGYNNAFQLAGKIGGSALDLSTGGGSTMTGTRLASGG